jgi:hypothetical protein
MMILSAPYRLKHFEFGSTQIYSNWIWRGIFDSVRIQLSSIHSNSLDKFNYLKHLSHSKPYHSNHLIQSKHLNYSNQLLQIVWAIRRTIWAIRSIWTVRIESNSNYKIYPSMNRIWIHCLWIEFELGKTRFDWFDKKQWTCTKDLIIQNKKNVRLARGIQEAHSRFGIKDPSILMADIYGRLTRRVIESGIYIYS